MQSLIRKGVAALTLVAAPLATAGPASAAPPERLDSPPPIDVEACGTTVTLSFDTKTRIHSKEGSDTLKFTGRTFVTVTTPDGRSARINASGPSRQTLVSVDPETGVAVLRLEARGQNFFFAVTPAERALSAETGLPVLAVTSGPVDVTLTIAPDGEVLDADVHRQPPRIRNACELLR